MKQFHVALIVVAVLSIVVLAKGANDEAEVRKLHAEYDRASVAQDATAFERLLHPDYTLIDPQPKVFSKAELIRRAKAGDVKFEMGKSDDVKVKVYGNLALVTGRWTEKGVDQGKPFSGTMLYTTVYLKTNGKWQIISDQVTPILEQQPTATGATTEQELRRLQQEYDNAWLQQDAAAFARLLAEDVTQVDPDGKVLSKAEIVTNAKSGDLKFEVGRSDDVKVRFYGDTALVTARWIEKSINKGKPSAGTMQMTVVWAKRNGNWQVVSDQVTLIPEQKPNP